MIFLFAVYIVQYLTIQREVHAWSNVGGYQTPVRKQLNLVMSYSRAGPSQRLPVFGHDTAVSRSSFDWQAVPCVGFATSRNESVMILKRTWEIKRQLVTSVHENQDTEKWTEVFVPPSECSLERESFRLAQFLRSGLVDGSQFSPPHKRLWEAKLNAVGPRKLFDGIGLYNYKIHVFKESQFSWLSDKSGKPLDLQALYFEQFLLLENYRRLALLGLSLAIERWAFS